MRKVQETGLIVQETVKNRKYKVAKAIASHDCSLTLIVKEMVFKRDEPLLWLQGEIMERLTVIASVNNRGVLGNLLEDHVLETVFIQGQEHKTVYITKPYLIGHNLKQTFLHTDLMASLLPKKELKQSFKDLLLKIMALMIGGTGHRSLIVTFQNLLFEEIGIKNLRPALNYFSFVGYHFLKSDKQAVIDIEQYKQIALFLDKEAIESGQIDRLQFKIRTVACLALGLILQKDPAQFILREVNKLGKMISRQKVLELHQLLVTPGLRRLLSSKEVKTRFAQIGIMGLEDIIRASLLGQSHEITTWQTLQTALRGQYRYMSSKATASTLSVYSEAPLKAHNSFDKVVHKLWNIESEGTFASEKLNRLGLGLDDKSMKSRERIFMALLMGHQMDTFLRYNYWQQVVEELKLTYQTQEMLQRLLGKVEKADLAEDTLKEVLASAEQLYCAQEQQEGTEYTYQLPSHRAKLLYDYRF